MNKNKKILISLLIFIGISLSANAFWGNNWGNRGGGNGWGNGWGNNWGNWNPYDVWDPRYWLEEMEDAFDDDWDNWGGYGSPYGGYGGYGNRGYGSPYGGYGGYGYSNSYGNSIDQNLIPSYNPYLPGGNIY